MSRHDRGSRRRPPSPAVGTVRSLSSVRARRQNPCGIRDAFELYAQAVKMGSFPGLNTVSRLEQEQSKVNDLERYFRDNTGRVIHKWHHYFEIYERHFAAFRNRPITVVEIGVFKGGSAQMWKHYFGPQARIVGIDIDPACSAFAEEQIEIIIGNQEDRTFLRSLAERIPQIDVLIDDGGHTMAQQIATFEELFPRVSPRGVYLCEDLHTSYWPEYGGGYLAPQSFIEYSKNFIDYIHAWHAREPQPPPLSKWYERPPAAPPKLSISSFTRSAHSLHFYDSVLVIEKRPMEPPTDSMTGREA